MMRKYDIILLRLKTFISSLIQVLLFLIVHLTETVIGFGASLFGNRFIYRNQYMPTKPGLAYKLRKPYAQKYGSFGDNFINMVCMGIFCMLKWFSRNFSLSLQVSTVPLYHQPVTSKPFVIAPFGTEGFTLSPEEERRRKIRRKRQRNQKRRIRGHRPDRRPWTGKPCICNEMKWIIASVLA